MKTTSDTVYIASNRMEDAMWHIGVKRELRSPSGRLYASNYITRCNSKLLNGYTERDTPPEFGRVCLRCEGAGRGWGDVVKEKLKKLKNKADTKEAHLFAELSAKPEAAKLREAALAWANHHEDLNTPDDSADARKGRRLHEKFLQAARDYAAAYRGVSL